MHSKNGLSIIMPVYNEEKILEASAKKVIHGAERLPFDTELIIVDDKSLDSSPLIADRLSKEFKNLRIIHHDHNLGAGGAFKTGILNSKYNWVILCPADNPFESREIQKFFAHTDDSDIVIGYRIGRPGYKKWVAFASRVYNLMIKILFGVRLRDFNWIHMYNKRILDNISINHTGIVFFAEVLIKASDLGYRIIEIESDMAPRMTGVSAVSRPIVIIKTFFGLIRLWVELRVKSQKR